MIKSKNPASSSFSFGATLFGAAPARKYFLFVPVDFVSFLSSKLFPCLLSPNPSTFSLAFLFSFYLAPPSPSSFFSRGLLLFFSRVHISLALHPEVCPPAFRFSRSLSRIRFLSCPFLSLPVLISPFSTLQLPFSHLSFRHYHRFHSIKHGWPNNTLVHLTLNPC